MTKIGSATVIEAEAPYLVLALLAGLALGAVFFGGLWWTVRRIADPSASPFGFLGSVLLRTALLLGGVYWVGDGDWHRLCACLVGFIAARILASRLARVRVAAAPIEAARGRFGPGGP
jgi:F1F0 ATPase subunit 2